MQQKAAQQLLANLQIVGAVDGCVAKI